MDKLKELLEDIEDKIKNNKDLQKKRKSKKIQSINDILRLATMNNRNTYRRNKSYRKLGRD